MAKKIRRMRTFARTASKSMEKQLVENAKQLKKDPWNRIAKKYKAGLSGQVLGYDF